MKYKQVGRKSALHLGGHVVSDAELQVVDDALHAVVRLLPGGAEELLHGPRHGGKDGLSCLPGVHQLPRVFWRGWDCFVVLVTPYVGKCFFYCHHQSGRNNYISVNLKLICLTVCLHSSPLNTATTPSPAENASLSLIASTRFSQALDSLNRDLIKG